MSQVAQANVVRSWIIMQTVYHLRTDELDAQFLESLKTLFKDKTIEIVVTEVDETAYLLHSDTNREQLLQAIEHVEKGENLVEVELDAL
jgi:antitoxin YefM